SDLTVTYSQPVIDYLDGITLLQHRAGRGIDSIRSIGTVRGFSPVAWTDRIEDGTITLVQSDSFLSLVKLVLRGRVDAIYANVDVVAHLFSQQPEFVSEKTPLVFDQSLPHDRGSYRLATLDQESIILEFNEWMELNSELIEQLKAEYFGSSRP
ncbi:MAG: transporter substrate-binding domain-containing protein, partial [Granulosicoccus sp.]|nr:transporter substrate-binding domain-containing protein [Granulosicoccus sp.]